MRSILILGTGGAPGNNVVSSFRQSPEKFYIIGTEIDKFAYFKSSADKTYLTPKSSDPKSFEALVKIIKKEKVSFIHAQPESEVLNLSGNRQRLDELNVKYLLPDHETILTCQNKFLSYQIWQKSGIKVPSTVMINSRKDLKLAFKELGKKIWIRKISGGGGSGALPTNDINQAIYWIDLHKGWGNFSGSEILSPKSTTFSSIWRQGELVVAQSRERISWEYGNKFLSGVSGITGAGKTINNPSLNKIAIKAILSIEKKPNGIFSVDLTQDSKGTLYVTEINIGRFFTTIHFFTELGLNMPYILLKTAFSEKVIIKRKINPLPVNMFWIRGMDIVPRLVSSKDFKKIKV